MTAEKQVFNTTDSPLITDDEGRTLGGGESGPVPSSPRINDLIKRGLLADHTKSEPDEDPAGSKKKSSTNKSSNQTTDEN